MAACSGPSPGGQGHWQNSPAVRAGPRSACLGQDPAASHVQGSRCKTLGITSRAYFIWTRQLTRSVDDTDAHLRVTLSAICRVARMNACSSWQLLTLSDSGETVNGVWAPQRVQRVASSLADCICDASLPSRARGNLPARSLWSFSSCGSSCFH